MNNSEEHLAFFSELGIAITQWAEVERAMFLLLLQCLPSVAPQTVAEKFFSPKMPFRLKMEWLSTAIQAKYPASPHLSSWTALQSRLNDLAKLRNQLAHRQMNLFAGGTPGKHWALIPWVPKAINLSGAPPNGAICVRDIVRIRFRFFAVAMSIHNLRARFAGLAEPYSSESEKPLPTLTLEQLVVNLRVLMPSV